MSAQAAAPTQTADHRPRLPRWLRRGIPSGGRKGAVEQCLSEQRLHTVCEEALCPNRAECFGRGTATFLVLGSHCTRQCRFCSVAHGVVQAPDPDEPARIAAAAREMGLDYVVVTSVTRDDLPDGGASHFAAIVAALRRELPAAGIEVLIPDFLGNQTSLEVVLESGPDVLNHNVETVPRLYPQVRPQADFERSCRLLRRAAGYGHGVVAKSGMMVGLGEGAAEVVAVLERLSDSGCSIVTIGQYLQPGPGQLPVAEFVTPEEFRSYEEQGRRLGITEVVAGPFVRSSYRAGETARSQRRRCGEHP
jgi:lipoic acid synthetase